MLDSNCFIIHNRYLCHHS